ncbi:MAG: FUSC family protein [Candidatus Microbacterium phytovorans]|uniref:FUSC family protein n=1 Tax=Candidatus Microbacterium phytovorans TaxID=3121374 RepID=A0AAJ6B2T7_9MICO|nr:FUSC family protein [Microbacterium sp.]WEK12307.1 MAG: FUSC family protein [Microbacterium sp.]
MSDPQTAPVSTGGKARADLRAGVERLRDSAPAIVQIVVAATGAYAFSHFVLGHTAPLLAATVTISSLGLVRDARPRRVLETVIGMVLGILIAEAILLVAGIGWWQLGLTLAASLAVARFLSPQPGFAIAAAIQSAIVMVIPASVPFLRLVDGVVGGIAALLVTALVPRNPVRAVTRDGHELLTAFDAAVLTLVQALRRGDRVRAERGLQKARALQPHVDRWQSSLESGLAIARISPFLRRQRFELQRQERVRAQLDLAVRNLRVIARRVVYVCDDARPRPIAADLLTELAAGARLIGESLDDISFEPPAREAVRVVAARLDPVVLAAGRQSLDQNLVGALRPLAVDLMTAAGMPAADARAALPRV